VPRIVRKLTAREVEGLRKQLGTHAVGDNLYVQLKGNGASWVFRYLVEYWRHLASSFLSRTRSREYFLQDEIAVSAGIMKFATRFLVVTVVGKNARFSVQCVRPVGIVHAGGKHKHLELACDLAAVSETTLTIYPQQLWQWIVSGIAAPATLVESIYMKVRST
jgi:hypothetical protein